MNSENERLRAENADLLVRLEASEQSTKVLAGLLVDEASIKELRTEHASLRARLEWHQKELGLANEAHDSVRAQLEASEKERMSDGWRLVLQAKLDDASKRGAEVIAGLLVRAQLAEKGCDDLRARLEASERGLRALEDSEKHLDGVFNEERAKLDASERGASAMREALESARQFMVHPRGLEANSEQAFEKVREALASDAGTGFVSAEQHIRVQAQCAAMREALESVVGHHDLCFNCPAPERGHLPDCVEGLLAAALASDAGSSVAAQRTALEEAAEWLATAFVECFGADPGAEQLLSKIKAALGTEA